LRAPQHLHRARPAAARLRNPIPFLLLLQPYLSVRAAVPSRPAAERLPSRCRAAPAASSCKPLSPPPSTPPPIEAAKPSHHRGSPHPRRSRQQPHRRDPPHGHRDQAELPPPRILPAASSSPARQAQANSPEHANSARNARGDASAVGPSTIAPSTQIAHSAAGCGFCWSQAYNGTTESNYCHGPRAVAN
jgi:hypothetical protein